MENDLESTRKEQAQDAGEIAWLDDSSDGLPPLKDPFWATLSSISDRLQVLGRIGKGGMSVVYKAQHLAMKKLVAVKLLLPHLTSDARSLKRFQLEAQATANLNHPNIVRIYDCGMSQDQAFIIMDFVEGESLEQLLDRESKLTPVRAMGIFAELCEGMNHAHESGIIHRDLKPSNVMLTVDSDGIEHVKIVDFGIAKLLVDDEDGSTRHKLTQTGDVFGSPLYMSPEQSVGGKIDKRSDIYSIGCLMYEVLAGRPPIVGKNFLDTMQRHSTDVPKPFAEKSDAKLMTRLQTIVFTCMAKDPADRYQDMKAILKDLHAAASGKESTAIGAWSNKEKSLAKIIKKESKTSRIIKTVALSAAGLFLALSGFALAEEIKRIDSPSSYQSQNAPLFKLVSLPKPTLFDNYETQKQNIVLAIDRTEAADDVQQEEGLETAARMYFAYGKWQEAKRQYMKLLKLPVGLEKQGDYHLGIGLCCLGENKLAAAKDEFKTSIDYYLKLQDGYQRGDEHPNIPTLLSGIYGIKARQPISYLALTEELMGNLSQAAANAKVLVISGRSDDDSERPAEFAYIADLNRRMQKYGTAVVTFENLKASESVVPERDYRTKLCFAIGLCLLASNEPARAATVLNEGLQLGATDKDLLVAMDHEYHRALWESGYKFKAFFEPHRLKVVKAEH
ncbi:MAG: serine/threonine protein kinase [Candidatus Melainabacteria bacterium]|nr:MAG: serine/threonine protein kinase [Candidatus Melainabacteria bacterium]